MTHTYNISGMTCSGCVAKVKSELFKLGDITSAEVQLTAPHATITTQHHLPVQKLQATVSKAGNYIITEAMGNHMSDSAEKVKVGDSYYPIFLIFGYITGITLLIQVATGSFDWMLWMQHFMAGFFLLFSFFKLLNLKGFAEGYSTYDVVAKRIGAYGYVYPFIELTLGVAFLTGFNPVLTNSITLIVMAVSTIGVAQSLLKKTQFQCACLGTIIKLPLSKVTLFEDALMMLMSGVTLTWLLS